MSRPAEKLARRFSIVTSVRVDLDVERMRRQLAAVKSSLEDTVTRVDDLEARVDTLERTRQ